MGKTRFVVRNVFLVF